MSDPRNLFADADEPPPVPPGVVSDPDAPVMAWCDACRKWSPVAPGYCPGCGGPLRHLTTSDLGRAGVAIEAEVGAREVARLAAERDSFWALAAHLQTRLVTDPDGSDWEPEEAVKFARQAAFVGGTGAGLLGWGAGEYESLVKCRDAVRAAANAEEADHAPIVDESRPDAVDRRPSDTAVDRELSDWLAERERRLGRLKLVRVNVAARPLPPERDEPEPDGKAVAP